MKIKYFIVTTLLFAIFILSSCSTTLFESPTVLPSQTPTQTLIPMMPTATIDWFPVTATPIIQATPTSIQATPTSVISGNLILEDQFNQTSFWNTATTDLASSSIENNKLILSVNQPAQITSMRNQPSLDNFRMDIQLTAKICGTGGSYGIIFRSANLNNLYKLVINCDKTIEIQRILNGNINHIMEPIYNPVIPTNLSEKAQISIIADGTNLDVYINHLKMISISDKYHTYGTIGFFAQATGDQPMTANFSNLQIYSVK